MSTSNTLTKNDLKKVLEKISIGSGGVIDADDMTQAEINNFLEDINAQGTPSEYRKLLWSNPSPTSEFSAQTISLDLSNYDDVDIVIYGGQVYRYHIADSLSSTAFTRAQLSGANYVELHGRRITISSTGIVFTDGYAPYGSTQGSVNNHAAKPYLIYGIRYEKVAPIQVNASDYVIEQGTSDIWTYRKWSSGIAECWGTWAGTLTHYGTQFGGYAFYTSVAFPSGLFISAPLITYSGTVDNSFCLTGTVLNLSKDSTNCYAISGSSGTQSVNFNISCKGRWK